jgi:hypothetical protein
MEITLSTAAIGHIKIKTTSKKQYNKNGRTKMITIITQCSAYSCQGKLLLFHDICNTPQSSAI